MINWRYAPGIIKRVDVRAAECPTLACFIPSRHTTRSATGASGCSSRTTEDWECLTRDQRGCPATTRPGETNEGRYHRRGGAWEWVPADTPVTRAPQGSER